MAKKEFRAESKRLLDLMIHSIYTNKDIFLRELISNASDATDKRYYQSIQTGGEALNRSDLPITLTIDSDRRQLILEDNGCGMTESELENNLGVIAQSGSLDFKENLEQTDEIDIIGQFGVGFYSAFMVADNVEVITKSMEDDSSHSWVSSGADGYTIAPADKKEIGTRIVLTIKESTDDEDYDQYLSEYTIQHLVKKHSDYIRYPIRMEVSKYREKEGGEEGETETYKEEETLNSMTPIWKRQKSDVTEEEYNEFYKEKFGDFMDPIKTIYTSTEGASTYNALLFIPSHTPFNYMSKDYKKGLRLYASGVLIMEHCEELLPDYFAFVKGVVDSQDLSLNISREMLQQDRQLTFMAGRIEKKIQSELMLMQKNQREDYEKVFENFGVSIKYGIFENYGMKKDVLQDLLMFHSSRDKMVTLDEYVAAMPESQKYIYYGTGEDIAQIKNLPAAESILDRGYELLYFTDPVDEFTIKSLYEYKEKEFRSIVGEDLGLETEEEKKEIEEKSKEYSELLAAMKEHLGSKVSDVVISNRLKNFPVVLTAKGELSLEMEKMLKNNPGNMPLHAEKVLELNSEHDIFKKLVSLFEEDNKDKLNSYTDLLYNQSLLLEGLPVENPVEFTKAISELMV